MINILMNEQQIHNLLVFLNRVEYRGLKEVDAVNEIIKALNNATEKKQAPEKSD